MLSACNTSDKSTYEVPYYNSPSFTPLWSAGKNEVDTLHAIPDFSFINQNGRIITQQTTHNKIYLVNFFFASCSGICPRMMGTLNKVADHFKDNKTVLFLSHSVDPENDTPAILKEYIVNHEIKSPNWHLLTGNKDSIYTIARKGYYIEQVMGFSKTTNDFLHSENIILVDKKKHIRGIYNGTVQADADKMIEDIEKLLKESEN